MHERIARIERADGDAEGRFTMTLATEGEASDGDILSIAGGQIPARMPLLISHWNDPTATAGSVVEPVKDLKAKPARLRAIGEIEMEGEGTLAEIRRDIAFMIDRGHVGAVSIRWDQVPGGKPPVRRVNLPSDHPAFVDAETEKDWRKRSGEYWEEWLGMEGSIVALGADPDALIGRSRSTQGTVSAFWRAMAEDAEKRDDGTADVSAALVALSLHADECRELGVDLADLVNAVTPENTDPYQTDFEPVEIAGRTYFLPRDAADELRSREETGDLIPDNDSDPEADPQRDDELEPDQEPAPDELTDLSLETQPFDQRKWIDTLRRLLDEQDASIRDEINQLISSLAETHDSELRAEFREMLEAAQGRVSRNGSSEPYARPGPERRDGTSHARSSPEEGQHTTG